MEQFRSFIAIELPDGLKLELAELEARLKASEQSWIKWVDPYIIHLTLKFLGNVASEKVSEVIKAIEEGARGISPFRLKVKDLGVFPNSRRVQVVWVGLQGEVGTLAQLQQKIDLNIAELGYPADSRPFVPHLTLARLRPQVSANDQLKLGQLIVATEFESTSIIVVDSISLMRSQLTREGAIYTRLGNVRLG